MEGGREDWGPSDNGEDGKTLFSSSGEPQEAMSEGVIGPKLAMTGNRWKVGNFTTHGGTFPNPTSQKILPLVCL